MASQDELNRKLLESIISEVKGYIVSGLLVPKENITLYDLLELPDADIKKATTHDVEKLTNFISSHLEYRTKERAPVDSLFGKKLNEITANELSGLGWSKVKSLIEDISKNTSRYFEVYFDPSKLDERDKKEYLKILDAVHIKDPFEFSGKIPLKFKKDVEDNPSKYLRLSFNAAQIYGRHREGLSLLLAEYVAESASLPENRGDGDNFVIVDSSQDNLQQEAKTEKKLQYQGFKDHLFKSDWHRFSQIRKAIILEQKAEKEYRKAIERYEKRTAEGKEPKKAEDHRLTTCLAAYDYVLQPKDKNREGLVELLGFNNLKEAVESGKYSREELDYYNSVIGKMRRKLHRETIFDWAKQDIFENTAIALLSLLAAGYLGHKYGDSIEKIIYKDKPVPGPTITLKEQPMPQIFTQSICNDKCSQYFTVPEPVQSPPEYSEAGCNQNCSQYCSVPEPVIKTEIKRVIEKQRVPNLAPSRMWRAPSPANMKNGNQ